jgi:hypothetical protein
MQYHYNLADLQYIIGKDHRYDKFMDSVLICGLVHRYDCRADTCNSTATLKNIFLYAAGL